MRHAPGLVFIPWMGKTDGICFFRAAANVNHAKISRNDPCPCGSGKKYKQCCLIEDAAREAELAARNRLKLNAPELMKSAVASHRAGDHAAAETAYRQLLDIDPKNSEVLCNLAQIARIRQDLDEALKLLNRALRIKPSALIFLEKGNVFLDRRQFEAAEESLRQSIAMYHSIPAAHFNLGITLKEQNRMPEAAACFRRVIELDRQFPQADQNLRDCLSGNSGQAGGGAESTAAIPTPPSPL